MPILCQVKAQKRAVCQRKQLNCYKQTRPTLTFKCCHNEAAIAVVAALLLLLLHWLIRLQSDPTMPAQLISFLTTDVSCLARELASIRRSCAEVAVGYPHFPFPLSHIPALTPQHPQFEHMRHALSTMLLCETNEKKQKKNASCRRVDRQLQTATSVTNTAATKTTTCCTCAVTATTLFMII